jgi:DNA-binding MarR family transcriptional regulator
MKHPIPRVRTELVAAIAEGMPLLKRRIAACHGPPARRGSGSPTHAQAAILHILSGDGALGVKALAARLAMTPSAATQLTDALVRTRLLVRREDPKDRRRISLDLTDRGRAALAEMRKSQVAAFGKFCRSLTDAELAALWRLHRKLIESHE